MRRTGTATRESSQPTKSRTGGSTFKNPEGHSSWKLIDEAGSKPLDFIPRWLGRDRFDKSAIDRQARMAVLKAHRDDVAVIDKSELNALGEIKRTAEERQALHQKPTRDFQEATDRRNGPDHRIRQR